MSLRVWLPLNGTLENKGLDDVVVTNNGATVDNNGKIGKCYSFSSKAIYGEVPNVNNMTEMSGCCWVYLTSLNSAQYFFHLGGINSYPSKISLDYEGSIRSQVNGTEYISGISLTTNTWYHITVTVGNSKVKWYLNGEEKASANVSGNFNASNHLAIGARINSSAGNTFAYPIVNAGRLNDFRLYDHALSPLEVKHISQGLILHYPLNRRGWGQENLLVDTYNWSTLTSASTVSEGYWYNNGGTAVRGYDNINNITYCKIWHSDSSSWTRYSRQYITMQPNTYYTVSILCRINTDIAHLSIRNDRNEAITFFASNVELTNKNWEWKFFTAKTHTNTSQEPFTIYAQVNSDGVLSSDTSIDIAKVKLEKGSIATPWCPNSSDALATTIGLNDNVEYDVSGYCNNGTRMGTFSWTSDTPKYNVSTIFNGTDNAIQTPSLPSMISDKNYTIAVWIYKTVIGSKGYQTIYGGPSGFEIEARNGGANETKFVPWNWGKPMASYELNEWNHCVFVHSDSDCKIYLNGEYIATGTAKASNPSGNYFVGAWNTATQQNFDGLMSDFRIYATALSAEDVKSLYQNSAYIDNQGNIYGAVYEEV